MLRRGLFFICLLLLIIGAVSATDNTTLEDNVASTLEDNEDIVDAMDDSVLGDDSVVQDFDYSVVLDKVSVSADGYFNYNVRVSHPSKSVNHLPVELVVQYPDYHEEKYFDYTGDAGVCSFLLKLGKGEYVTSTSTNYGNVYSIDYGSISVKDTSTGDSKSAVSTGKLKVSAPKVSVTKGAGKYFKVSVKKGGVPVKGLTLKVKVFTGKKFKTYTVKTDKYGVAKVSTKKLKLGSHKVKVVCKNKKYKFSKASKIVVKKKSNLRHFTLKLKYSSFYPDKKKFKKGDVVTAWFETDYGRQDKPGVYVEANYIPDGRSLPKYIKLVKAKFYFSTYRGPDKVISVKAKSRGWISGGLYRDYTPYKVVVYYKV